jgi:hypothetical protein
MRREEQSGKETTVVTQLRGSQSHVINLPAVIIYITIW